MLSKYSFSFATILFFLIQTTFANTLKKETHHIYLLIGQSNMAGRAPIKEEKNLPLKQAYVFTSNNTWENAKNPLNRYSTIRKNLKMQKTNLGYAFAQTMLKDKNDITIGLVVNAKGGTRIEQWAKDTEFYKEAVERARVAMQTGTLKGILWHQGESNAGKADEYLEKLKALIENLRHDLKVPDCPFVAGQVFFHSKTKPATKAINDELHKLPSLVHKTQCVSSEGCTTFDNTHFDAKSTALLGQRYAKSIIALTSK
jgi:hypothetical protein